jgi:hypothetical protein
MIIESSRQDKSIGISIYKCKWPSLKTVSYVGGSTDENDMHSLNDTLRLLECATSSLRIEATKSKDTSYATFSKLSINTVHCIKDTLTLYRLSTHDASYWKYV